MLVVIQAQGRAVNGVTMLPTLTAVKFSATAAGDIGLAAQAIKTNVENLTGKYNKWWCVFDRTKWSKNVLILQRLKILV